MRRAPGFERARPTRGGVAAGSPAAAHVWLGMTGLRGLRLVLGAAFVALATAPAAVGATCGVPGYSYAGVLGDRPASTIAATVAAVQTARVESGHVAAWIGVGGAGAGVGGRDAWLQTG